MREILFRGRAYDGRWVYGSLIQETSTVYIREPLSRYPVMVAPDTVGQYTGITTANGQKVFEGDRCEFSVFDYNDSDTQYTGVVVFSGSRFMLWKTAQSEYYGADGGFDLDWVVNQDDEFKVVEPAELTQEDRRPACLRRN